MTGADSCSTIHHSALLSPFQTGINNKGSSVHRKQVGEGGRRQVGVKGLGCSTIHHSALLSPHAGGRVHMQDDGRDTTPPPALPASPSTPNTSHDRPATPSTAARGWVRGRDCGLELTSFCPSPRVNPVPHNISSFALNRHYPPCPPFRPRKSPIAPPVTPNTAARGGRYSTATCRTMEVAIAASSQRLSHGGIWEQGMKSVGEGAGEGRGDCHLHGPACGSAVPPPLWRQCLELQVGK